MYTMKACEDQQEFLTYTTHRKIHTKLSIWKNQVRHKQQDFQKHTNTVRAYKEL